MDEDSRFNSSSQISSVGFTNLKKLNTNSSVSTNTSTTSSKPNPLTRLFTRNRSNTTLGESTSDDDIVIEEKSQDKAVFRLSKSMKRRPKKDLAIQTELKEPPPVHSRKTSMNSPVSSFQNFFQRSNTGGIIISTNNEFEEPVRSTVTLSSNNSNSKITDPNIIKVFKFTDPINSLEEDGEDLESYKKMFLPADQFLRSKSPSSPTNSDNDNSHHDRFWNHLLTLLKPVILSSQQRRLTNGHKASQLILTQEGISNYIQENYTKYLRFDDEETIELTSREIAQDCNNFFNKVVILFFRDFRYQGPDDNSWLKLNELWLYFRNKIYFFMVDCFSSIKEISTIFIDIESLLLNSFKKIVVVPLLDTIDKNTDHEFVTTYKNGKLLKNMLQCFGFINSYSTYEDEKFSSYLMWLTSL